MNFIFIIFAALLLGGVTFWLCKDLWRGAGEEERVESHNVNAAVIRDQWNELDKDLTHGTLSANDLTEARAELQQRILEETKSSKLDSVSRFGGKRGAIVLSVLLPVAVTLSYVYLGAPEAMSSIPARNTGEITEVDVRKMVASLESRLAQNPDDPMGWLMLARSYRHFERYEEAIKAFKNSTNLIQQDPVALSEYAETLARTRSSGFEGEPTQLLERALSLDNKAPMALTLAGAAALERRDYDAAIDYWGQLLELLPPGTESFNVVSESIDQVRQEQDN